MRQRRLANYHSLKRLRVRQTWNKHNLFNISQIREPNTSLKTFFQQKWAAKAATRAYHGEHIRERQWERMFSRRLPGVVDVDPSYLASNDGSEFSAGRGSGRTIKLSEDQSKGRKPTSNPAYTPYMQMIYGPQERRLDIAIFRALFASSTRQARQMCIHGAVTVNGQKMVHPTYRLNPGDMFQVDIDRVMTATGRKKFSEKQFKTIDDQRRAAAVKEAKERVKAAEPKAARSATTQSTTAQSTTAQSTTAADSPELPSQETATRSQKEQIDTLNAIARQARELSQARGSMALPARRKQAVRALIKDIKGHLARVKKTEASEVDATIDDVTDILGRLSLFSKDKQDALASNKEASGPSQTSPFSRYDTAEEPESDDPFAGLTEEQKEEIFADVERQMAEDEEEKALKNVEDRSKPYMTPWKPKPFMPAFAFIPRYLEVNQKICAAVYLRHPVARKGLGEVPTPFGRTVNELAFNWYLRRG